MSVSAIVVLTVVITLAAGAAGLLVVKARQKGLATPWDKIRPIITAVFTEAMKVYEADKLGYQALEDYAVSLIVTKIDEADFLVDAEKALLTPELIRTMIRPTLTELYAKKG